MTRYVRDRPNKTGWVHPLLKEVAIGFAQTIYDRMALDNRWYSLNKDEKKWVRERWPDMLPAVRTHLGALCGPTSPLPDSKKTEVAQALIDDNQFRLGRHRAQDAKVRRVLQ